MGYFVEDLKPGMSESHARTVTERDIASFGELTGDMNPAHFDEAYAQGTPFKGRIAHGMLSAGFFSTVFGMKMPGPGTIYMSQNLRFKAPVRIGDHVVATCTVKEVIPEKRRVIFDCTARVGDTVVIEGDAMVMAPSRAAKG